ncbi:hypothetical protein [Flavihumibacter petaseus]|uniref:Uncharacterized protein n=1 Tax=Flavihumibacter petaseus NBRC 106054 TaxID=1220578 RepID=A0A0E9N0C9_9BACT|nr:hypothetical protein [Flavihumibacter petaseus]GAO43447.1 hypothetical protein FPE01S_02_05520 [Flavihumibacter petaseus NBRC 106054]
MDFNETLESALKALSLGDAVALPTAAGILLAVDAGNEEAADRLAPGARNPVLLLAEERDLLQYISALDLSVADQLREAPPATAFRFSGVLQVADAWLNSDGSIPVALSKDTFSFHLLKRFRRALVLLEADAGVMAQYAGHAPASGVELLRQGYLVRSFE